MPLKFKVVTKIATEDGLVAQVTSEGHLTYDTLSIEAMGTVAKMSADRTLERCKAVDRGADPGTPLFPKGVTATITPGVSDDEAQA